ncbi:unnamed protein product, partial [Polarella glacialis]
VPSVRALLLRALCGASAWSIWYALVLKPAAKSLRPWGPKWLAVLLSGALHRFGSWWLRFSHNGEESIQAGTWAPGKQYVMAWQPHGALTVAALYFMSFFWVKGYPSSSGGVRGDVGTFNGLLGQGASVAVQPGGLVEQVATDESAERVFFPANLGFIRLALKHGVPLLPVYAFGENQLYKTSSWSRRLNNWFYRRLKTGNLVVIGQGGIPCSPLLPNPLVLPIFRRELHIRFGESVDLGTAEQNPTEEPLLRTLQLAVVSGLWFLWSASMSVSVALGVLLLLVVVTMHWRYDSFRRVAFWRRLEHKPTTSFFRNKEVEAG